MVSWLHIYNAMHIIKKETMSDLLKVVSHDKPPTKSFLKHQTVLLWKEAEDKLQYVIALSHSLRTPLTVHKHTFDIDTALENHLQKIERIRAKMCKFHIAE